MSEQPTFASVKKRWRTLWGSNPYTNRCADELESLKQRVRELRDTMTNLTSDQELAGNHLFAKILRTLRDDTTALLGEEPKP